jgi:benzodiazapine receptor
MRQHPNYPRLIISLFLPQFAGVIGALSTAPVIPTWYASLQKPPLNPPGWVFSPVWIALYTLMGFSFYLIWQTRPFTRQVQVALILFTTHLIFNSLWSIIFFGLRNPGLAFAEILLLLVLIAILIFKFWPLNRTASLFLAPYFLWTSFATYLNFSVWQLNR